MLSMKHFAFVLATLILTNISAAHAANNQEPPATGPGAMMRDQIDQTDIYAIPYDDSTIEDEQEQKEMENIESKFKKAPEAKKA